MYTSSEEEERDYICWIHLCGETWIQERFSIYYYENESLENLPRLKTILNKTGYFFTSLIRMFVHIKIELLSAFSFQIDTKYVQGIVTRI